MSAVTVTRAGAAGARWDDPSLKRQQSLLFPALFSQLDKGGHFTVLDIGPAMPETIQFFSPFRCRLHCAGMYSEPLVRNGGGQLSAEERVRAFTECLAIPADTRFDLCLLWDFPNYLEDADLQAFSAALTPHLHKRTAGHAFAVRSTGTRIDHRWYGIDQPHLFTLRAPWEPHSRINPHSQAILINLLTCFNIDRGMLLPDGRLEVALKSNL
jgi:hypothetical protein